MKNHIAIVTGGLQGIGLAITAELTRQNIWVAVGARSATDSDRAASAVKAIGNQGMVATLDVQSTSSVTSFVAKVEQALGTPTILVNAAGVSVHQVVDGHSDEDWHATIDTNLSGPFRMIRACLPGMKRTLLNRPF